MTTDPISHTVIVSHPTEAALARGPAAAMEMAEAFEIVDAETFTLAADELKAVKARLEKLDEQRRAITRPLDDAKHAVMALFRAPVAALVEAELLIKSKMLAFQQAEQKRADEERLLREKAATAERERLESEAQALEAKGLEGEAFATREVASMVMLPSTSAPPPKIAGISTHKTVDYEVVNLRSLIAHIAAHPDLSMLLVVDSVALRAYTRSLGTACQLPGVRIFSKESISARKK